MESIKDFQMLDDECFFQLSDEIINRSALLINNKYYRIIEIEFYLKSDNHPDLYTHCDKDQLRLHTFYFHKFKTGTFKSGTFKGVDITLGDKKTKTYFGILMRSIQDTETGCVIEGPCNVVNHILKKYKCESIIQFLNDESELNIFNNERNFTIVNYDYDSQSLWNGPRIGLGDKYPKYRYNSYRFVLDKIYIKKLKSSLTKIF